MSGDAVIITDVVPPGTGLVLDLGGGDGRLREPVQRLGYQYVNLDIQPYRNGEPSVVGDAHALPFRDASFDLAVCKEALTTFRQPWEAVKEIYRVLKPGGLLVLSAGFMWPAGADLCRFTPDGLRHLLKDFQIVSIESPLSIFTMLGSLAFVAVQRMGLGIAERPLRSLCYWLDGRMFAVQKRPSNFAASYRVIARKHATVTSHASESRAMGSEGAKAQIVEP